MSMELTELSIEVVQQILQFLIFTVEEHDDFDPLHLWGKRTHHTTSLSRTGTIFQCFFHLNMKNDAPATDYAKIACNNTIHSIRCTITTNSFMRFYYHVYNDVNCKQVLSKRLILKITGNVGCLDVFPVNEQPHMNWHVDLVQYNQRALQSICLGTRSWMNSCTFTFNMADAFINDHNNLAHNEQILETAYELLMANTKNNVIWLPSSSPKSLSLARPEILPRITMTDFTSIEEDLNLLKSLVNLDTLVVRIEQICAADQKPKNFYRRLYGSPYFSAGTVFKASWHKLMQSQMYREHKKLRRLIIVGTYNDSKIYKILHVMLSCSGIDILQLLGPQQLDIELLCETLRHRPLRQVTITGSLCTASELDTLVECPDIQELQLQCITLEQYPHVSAIAKRLEAGLSIKIN
jgi:hypothetical protein